MLVYTFHHWCFRQFTHTHKKRFWLSLVIRFPSIVFHRNCLHYQKMTAHSTASKDRSKIIVFVLYEDNRIYFISWEFFFYYFIFKLYIIVLVLPNIKMNPVESFKWGNGKHWAPCLVHSKCSINNAFISGFKLGNSMKKIKTRQKTEQRTRNKDCGTCLDAKICPLAFKQEELYKSEIRVNQRHNIFYSVWGPENRGHYFRSIHEVWFKGLSASFILCIQDFQKIFTGYYVRKSPHNSMIHCIYKYHPLQLITMKLQVATSC